MPWFIIVYLLGALAALVLSAIGHSKKHEGFIMAGVVIGLICGLILGFGAFGSSTGAGHYAYYVNGVRVASGFMIFFEAIAIAIIFGALPNLLGMMIAGLPKAFRSSGTAGNAPTGIRILCIFLFVESILGFLVAVILAIVKKSVSGLFTGLISSGTLFLIAMFMKKKWNIH
jgi:hypothetical protein